MARRAEAHGGAREASEDTAGGVRIGRRAHGRGRLHGLLARSGPTATVVAVQPTYLRNCRNGQQKDNAWPVPITQKIDLYGCPSIHLAI